MNRAGPCSACWGKGYVPCPGTAPPAVDACPRCAEQADLDWMQSKRSETMARMKRKSTMVQAPRDAAEAALFLGRIGAATRQRNSIQLDLNERIAVLTAAADASVRPLDLEVEQLIKGMQLWAEANRAELTRNGATKTIHLATGDVAWRTLPPKVSIRGGADAVIEALRRLSLDRFLRTKTEIDRDAMLREPAAATAVPGVTVGSEGEDFVVTPASVDLPGAAVAA